MKKIITALANPILNETLKKNEEIEIITKDISYQEGIFEVLEKEEKIDGILLSDSLAGMMSITNILKKIQESKKIEQIILILKDKKQEIKKEEYRKINLSIFYEEEITTEKIIQTLLREKEQISKEVIEKIKENEKQEKIPGKKNKKNKSITITGILEAERNQFLITFSKIISNSQTKILIMDLDVLPNSNQKKIETSLGENKRIAEETTEYNEKIEKKKISENIDLVEAKNLIYSQKRKFNEIFLVRLILKLKQQYEIILFNTSIEYLYQYTKMVMNQSNQIIFLAPLEKKEITKTRKMLEIYTKIWKIEKEKINLVFSKNKKSKIEKEMIKEIFNDYYLLGQVQIEKQIQLEKTGGIMPFLLKKQIKEEYWNIAKEILKK